MYGPIEIQNPNDATSLLFVFAVVCTNNGNQRVLYQHI